MLKTKSNNFNLIRLVLALLVLMAHWNELTQSGIENIFFQLSGYSVDMFFIISGFLIFWSYDNDQNKTRFYIKRFFRIFPLYFFVVLMQTVFFLVEAEYTFNEVLKYFLANITFLNFLQPSVGSILDDLHVNAINGSLWTLKNEVFFYFIVPCIFYFFKRYGLKLLIFLYTISIIYMIIVNHLENSKLLVLFPSQLRLFITGILLYVLFDRIKQCNMHLLFVISLVLLSVFSTSLYFKILFYPILLGIMLIYLIYYVKNINIKFDFSYSVYILHFPLIQLSLYYGINSSNRLFSIVTLFITTIFLSYILEKNIEKKFINKAKQIIKKKYT